MCIISSYVIILKFVQIPWPDVHMTNLKLFLSCSYKLHYIAYEHPSLKKARI